ncbi:MAG: hypothetical protein H6Q68_527 [Firmicutes bacterium]|nr:hypothetical protein [Bacillota bacterium]
MERAFQKVALSAQSQLNDQIDLRIRNVDSKDKVVQKLVFLKDGENTLKDIERGI